jgi:uncharacterized protein YutE (UPF0331/DUF86 family)
MIDKQVVCDKLAQLRERQPLLQQLAAKPREDFVADPIACGAAERLLQVSIEICLDLGHHLIAALGLERPSEYRDVFRILGSAGILAAELSGRMELMAAFRNRLVHLYAAIDPARVHGFLQRERADFDEFARAVATFVRGQPPA